MALQSPWTNVPTVRTSLWHRPQFLSIPEPKEGHNGGEKYSHHNLVGNSRPITTKEGSTGLSESAGEQSAYQNLLGNSRPIRTWLQVYKNPK